MATNSKGNQPAPQKKPAPAKAAGFVPHDWERIELDYRAGIKTLRQIADEHGISHTLVARKAKQFGWSRDLLTKINAKADELVSKDAVSKGVTMETRVAERDLIDANAKAVADVRLAHRRDIHRARRLTNALLDELEKQSDPETLSLLNELGELLRNPDEKTGRDRLHELYQAVISLPERSKTMKVLADSLRITVDMERQAFGMDAKGAEGTPGGSGYVPPAVQVMHVKPPKREEEE